MNKLSIAVSLVALLVAGSSDAIAQTAEFDSEHIIEIQREARTQMEDARRQLEEAARTIAQSGVNQNGNFNYRLLSNARFPNAELGLSIVDAREGALVTYVTPGRGGDTAGVEVGDVIRSIDGIQLQDGDRSPTTVLQTHLAEAEPGDTVALTIERGGELLSFDVETGEGSAFFTSLHSPDNGLHLSTLSSRLEPLATFSDSWGSGGFNNVFFGVAGSPWSDMELVSISAELGRYFDTTEGLLVVSAPGDDAVDIQDGDVILEISGRTPNSPEHAVRILSSFETNETVEFSIMRDGRRRTIEYDGARGGTAGDEPVVPIPD